MFHYINNVDYPVQRIGYNTWANCSTSGRTGQVVALGKNRATIASIGRVYKFCSVATNNGTSQNPFYCMFGPKPN